MNQQNKRLKLKQRKPRVRNNQQGQSLVEYLLILTLVWGGAQIGYYLLLGGSSEGDVLINKYHEMIELVSFVLAMPF